MAHGRLWRCVLPINQRSHLSTWDVVLDHMCIVERQEEERIRCAIDEMEQHHVALPPKSVAEKEERSRAVASLWLQYARACTELAITLCFFIQCVVFCFC